MESVTIKIHWPMHRHFCIMDNISDPKAPLLYAETNTQAALVACLEIVGCFGLPKKAQYTQPVIRAIRDYFKLDSPDFQVFTIHKKELFHDNNQESEVQE